MRGVRLFLLLTIRRREKQPCSQFRTIRFFYGSLLKNARFELHDPGGQGRYSAVDRND
jgi:hypothetical protein